MEWWQSFYGSSAFWCLIGILGGFIVSAFFFALGKSRKSLRHYTVSTKLITQEMAKIPGLQILMNNQSVDNLVSTTIKFWNTGNQAITFQDFATKVPFGIKISEGHFFHSEESISISQTNPNSSIKLTPVDDSEIQIYIEFLNPRDGFAITVLHDGVLNEQSVTGSLIGGSIIPSPEDLSPFYGSKADLFVYIADKYLIPTNNYKMRDYYRRKFFSSLKDWIDPLS